tara:strand:+ start:1062 stop:1358 length:297 start_codon:yes stop_codon:yes gene_type:complete
MKIEKGTAKNKKWKAVFSQYVDGKMKKLKVVQFGDNRYEDYTQHKDKDRRKAYKSRHQKDLEKGDPMSAGFLSYYILWGTSTDINKNISAFKRKFKFK